MKVKGIAREILPYAVLGLLDDEDLPADRIDKKGDGWSLRMDLSRLGGEAKASAVAGLESVLRRLKG